MKRDPTGFLPLFVKTYVYKNKFNIGEELLSCINKALISMTREMLTFVLNSTVRRPYMYLETIGNLFEHLLY